MKNRLTTYFLAVLLFAAVLSGFLALCFFALVEQANECGYNCSYERLEETVKVVGVRELKIRTSEILREVENDEDVIITRNGKPLAVIHRLRPDQLRLSDCLVSELAELGPLIAVQYPTMSKVWGDLLCSAYDEVFPDE